MAYLSKKKLIYLLTELGWIWSKLGLWKSSKRPWMPMVGLSSNLGKTFVGVTIKVDSAAEKQKRDKNQET